MNKPGRIIFVGLLASFLCRADLVTTANCSATFGTTSMQTGATSCSAVADNSLGFPVVFADASIAGTETIPPPGSSTSPTSISFTFSTSTSSTVGVSMDDANVSGSDSLILTTAGPLRPGKAIVTESVAPSGLASNLMANLTLSSFTATCTAMAPFAPACTGNLGPTNGSGSTTLPFTLGESFGFNVSLFDDSPNGNGTPHYGFGSVSLSFTLLEADGTTPVQVLTPEPSTYGILGFGLILLSGVLASRKSLD